MSEVESYRGRLIPVDLKGISLDLWIQRRLKTDVRPDWLNSWIEMLEEELYGQYFYDPTSQTLYEIERERLDPDGFVHSISNPDGSFDFTVSYYNGGASFSDVARAIIRA